MSWDDATPAAPVYGSDIAPGPRLGFLGALEASYDDQVRNASMRGLAYSFMKADEDEATKAKENGRDYQPFYKRKLQDEPDPITGETPVQGMSAYTKIARTLVDHEDNDVLPDFADHDAHTIEENAKGGYQVKTMQEIFDGVKAASARAEQQANLPKTLGGYAGSFVGAVGASLNAPADPLTVATLPFGGAGKTVLARVASQGLTQGAVEAVNQVTGVQENKRLLGLDHGTGDALMSIGGAVVGGAALQGLGEGVGAAFRRVTTGRWFADAPGDKAPVAPPEQVQQPTPNLDWLARSPLSDSPIGRPRAEADLTVVHSQLSDWGGPRPIDVSHPTDTRIRVPGEEPSTDFKLDYKAGPDTLDTIARRVDPELFEVYDKYAALKNDARSRLDALGADRNSQAVTAVQDIQDKIDNMRQTVARGPSEDSPGQWFSAYGNLTQMERRRDNFFVNAAQKVQDKIDQLNAKLEGYAENSKRAYNANTKIAELERQRDSFLAVETKSDTPEMQLVRNQLMHADEQMRDMSPAVTRAYASAQNKWQVYEGQRQQIAQMIREGRAGIDDIPNKASGLPEEPPEGLTVQRPDPIPERATVAHDIRIGEPVAAAIERAQDTVIKLTDEALDTFKAFAKKAATEEPGKAVDGKEPTNSIMIRVRDKDIELPLDSFSIKLENENGDIRNLTPRELLREVHNDNQMLEAVTTCSISATS